MTDWADQIVTSPGTPLPPPQSPTEDWADAITPPSSDIGRSLDVNLLSADVNKTTPERAARVLEAQKKTGLPINLVDSQLDTVEQEAKKQDFNAETFSKENPAVAKWMSENPQQAALGKDDSMNLSATEKLFRNAKEIFYDIPKRTTEETRQQLQTAWLSQKERNGNITPEEQARLEFLRHQDDPKELSGFPWFVQQVVQGGAQSLSGLLMSQEQAMAGAVAGGSAAFAGGPLTWPLIPETAASGYAVGSVYGMAEQVRWQEAGSAREEFLKIRGTNGEPLDIGVVNLASDVVGLINAPIEFIGLGAIARTIPGAKEIIKHLTKDKVQELLKRESVVSALKEVSIRLGDSTASNALQEALQETTTILAGEISKDISTGVFQSPTIGEQAARVAEAAKGGAAMGFGLALPGTAITFTKDVQSANQAKQQEQFFKALGDTSKNSKLRESLPAGYQQIIENITKDGPIENVYTPIEFFQSHFQEAGIDPRAVAVELGIEKAYDEATQSGSKLAIPTGVYATKIAPTDNNAAFVKELALTPDGLTSREADDLKAEFDKAKQAEPTTIEQSLQKVREDVHGKLSAIMPADVAERQATLWQERYRARAERLGMDPWTLYQQRPISFTSEVDGKTVNVQHVDRGTTGLVKTEEIQARADVPLWESNANAWAEKMPGLPRDIYEKLARFSSADIGVTQERQLQKFVTLLLQERNDPEAAMRAVWGSELADAPRGLRSAFTGELVLPQASFGISQKSRQAGDLNKGPALTLTPNTIVGEGPYRVTHWLDGLPVRHEAFPDTTTAEKAFDQALTDTNTTAEKMGEKAITEQQTLFQQAKDQTETPEFKRWFGDSKVVDENGKPLVVYHGSRVPYIDQFDLSMEGTGVVNTGNKKFGGIWFTSSKDNAASFADQREPVKADAEIIVYGDGPYYAAINDVDGNSLFQVGPYNTVDETKIFANEAIIKYNIDPKRGEGVFATYLSLKNPLVLDGVIPREKEFAQARGDGSDGIIARNVVDGREFSDIFVAFRPEQIKSAIGNRGTFDPNNPNILYQSGTEEPRLSVLHNLSSENLEHADKMGGLAVPSLGVVKEGMGLEGYGDITLIGPRELADPKLVDVYDADAYTSTFPRPEYRKVKSSIAQKFVDQLRGWANKFDDQMTFSEAWDNAVNKPKPWDTVQRFLNGNAAKAWFLNEQGIETKPVMSFIEPRWGWTHAPAWLNFVKTADHEADNLAWDDPKRVQYLKDAGTAAVEAMRENSEKYRDAGFTQEDIDAMVAQGKENFISDDGSIRYGFLVTAIKSAGEKGQKKVNRAKTERKLDNLLKGKESEFKQWVEDKIIPMYGDPFLTLGKKKVEYNLQNIVDYMTRSGTQAQEKTMTFGEGMARATAAVKIRDFQEMRNRAKAQITERGEVDKIREEAKKAMEEWRNKVVDYYGDKSSREFGRVWEGLDASMRAIAKWAKGRGLAEALRSEDFKNVPDYVIDQGKEAGKLFMEAPVPYFEAKPERAVKLDEFSGAVIPADASKNIKAILDKHKIPYQTYPKRFDEAARTQVVDKFRNELAAKGENVLFQKERGVTRFTDRTVNIGLFKDADLSTLLHESGHVFLLDMHGDVQYLRSLKELNTKQQGVIEDFNNILNWLGITEQELLEQTTVDGKITLTPKSVKANEQFARGMEAYLAEGKAPSIELRSAFQRFKAWMVQVYRLWKKDATISKELNVHLNDEVRAIMDRLLATDDQIKAAQVDAEITPIFTDAASAGMSDIQFDAYRKTLEQESARAKENLEQQLIKEYQRERQQQWKDEREKVRAKVDNEIGAIPIYGALDSLKSTEPGNIKFNRAAVIERYGKDRAKALPTGIMNDNGIDPDTAAEMLGFKSGEDLTSQLASMQSRNKLIETETDRRMYETHGNILMDGGIVEKAKESVRDSGRSDIIAEELKALQKKMREVKPFVEAAKKEDQQKQVAGRQIYLAAVPTVKEARVLAEQSIASSKMREIRPMQFFYAARKASKAAVEAMRKGDVLVAAVNKRQELIATEMYRVAVKAQKEIDKIVKNQKSFDKTSKRERIGKAGGDFLDQIDTLRARYNLHPQSEAAFAKKKVSLREWYDEQIALGFVPGIDPDLLDESKRLDYRDATLDELRALNDAVNSIAFIAGRQGQIATMQKHVAMEEAISAMKDRADITLKKVDKKKERILKNWLDRSNDKIKGFDVSLAPMETIMEILDGGAIGPFHDYIFNLASEAQTAEYDLSQSLGEEVRKIVHEFVSEDTGRITDMFQTTLFPESISRFKLISLAFNIGNESSFDKLVRGYGWQGREQEVMRMLQQLDVKDFEFVQKVWDKLDTLYPALNELQKKVSGLPLPRVESRAVTISAKDGDITLKGGYYPAVYDPELSIQGTKQDTGPLVGLTERGYSSAVAPDSFRKGRTKYAGPMLLDFEHVLNRHITGVIKDLTHREFLIDMNRLFKNQEFRNIIRDHLGAEYGKMFMPWLKGVANDRNTGEINTAFDSLWEGLRSRVTIVALGYKVTSSLAQLSGYSNSIEYISDHYGSAYLASATAKFFKNPLENYRLVSEKSGEMKHRFDTIDRDVRDELRKISAGKVGMMRAAIERAGFYGINFMDRMVSIPTWMAAYQGALDKGITEQQAIHAGDAAVRRSQGAGGAKDLNTMQRKRGFNKILTLFYTPFAAWYGRLRQIKSNLKQQGWKYTPEAIMHVAMITLIQSALSEILAGRGPTQKCEPDDLECMGKWLAAKSVSSLAAPVPVLRDIGNTIESYIQSGRMQDTRYSPVLDAISKIGKTGIRTGEALFGDREFDDELAFDLFETSGYFMGLPTAQPRITLQYLYDLMNDETSPETPMEFLHGLAYRRVR